MNTPHYLKPGDTVSIASTARKITAEELQPAIEIIESWGLKVKLPEQIHAASHQFAGTDEERAATFQSALDDPEVKAIFCARGGYGTVRMVDNPDFTTFLQQPKWIAGFSDITVLHSHIQQHFSVETLHSCMPIMFANTSAEALDSLRSALFGKSLQYEFGKHGLNRQGAAEGILTGGNLSVLYSIIGSASETDFAGKILFLEDLDEYLYHVDRMMMNLKRAGKLKNLKGLIVGGMTAMNDNEVPFGKTAEEIIAEHVAEYEYPVCFGFPAGHIKDNRALILGRKSMLNVGRTTTLTF